jgi:hypothetical protein
MPLFTPDLDLYLAVHEPGYLEYVAECRTQGIPLRVVLQGYRNNWDRVQACLWYAIEQGLSITIIPPNQETQTVDETQIPKKVLQGEETPASQELINEVPKDGPAEPCSQP